jgi:hypothetical protein
MRRDIYAGVAVKREHDAEEEAGHGTQLRIGTSLLDIVPLT